jgi:Na+-driven multidrug efflux pump
MSNGSPDKFKPALIGGAAAGLASSIPPIYCLNCFCCALYIGGGFLAAYLYLKEAPPTAEAPLADGAVLGALAGVVAAVVGGFITLSLALLFDFNPAQIVEMVEGFGGEIPPEFKEALEQQSAQTGLAAQLFNVLIGGVIAIIFSTLGGVLAAALGHKKAAPPAPPMAPPPPAVG